MAALREHQGINTAKTPKLYQPTVMQCILCGQQTLADRFLRNVGYLAEREVFSTFGCQFPSKRGFERSKNTEVCLNLTLKWQRCDAFLP